MKNPKEEVSETVAAKLSKAEQMSGLKFDELHPSMQASLAKVVKRLPEVSEQSEAMVEKSSVDKDRVTANKDSVTDKDIYQKRYDEVESELDELFSIYHDDIGSLLDTPQSEARDLRVIDRVRQYAIDVEKLIVGECLKIDSERVNACVKEELLMLLPKFLNDTYRRAIVRFHAQGFSTSEAVYELACQSEVIEKLSKDWAIGWDVLRAKLIHHFSYLKPGTSGWSENKYGETYRDARAAYKEAISDLPLSSAAEQAAFLVKHAKRIEKVLESRRHDTKSIGELTTALTKTMEGLRKLSCPAPQRSIDPQLIFNQENILVLPSPERLALPGVKEEIVNRLEHYLQCLKGIDNPKAIEETKSDHNVIEVAKYKDKK